MPSLALLQRHLWVSSRKRAEKSLGHARQLLLSRDPTDIHTALRLLDATLRSFPQWEKAIELKARALLYLRRFRDIVSLLQESVPSLKAHPSLTKVTPEEKIKLLPSNLNPRRTRKVSFTQCFSLIPLQRHKWVLCSSKGEREQWKYIVLGQACRHLGMMEDAMILLSNGKRFASAAQRKQSSRFNEDSFLLDGTHAAADVEVVNDLLINIKSLLRRRTAALAALDVGLYTEAARHFSKIIDGRKGTPQGFVAECYMYRAFAHQAANKIVDALADYNRCLVLNPMCAEALSTRATLYEAIGCHSDSMEDLESLKSLYEMISATNMQWVHSQSSSNSDLQGCIDFINGRLASMMERGNGRNTVDHHRILGLSRGCSRAEVERAYLLLSLKHRPDKSAHFVDRCEFVDDRDIEVVKGEARTFGLRLFNLLQKAYTWIVSRILEEEMNMVKVRHVQECSETSLKCSKGDSSSSCWEGKCPMEHAMHNQSSFGVDREAHQAFFFDGVAPHEDSLNCKESLHAEISPVMAFEHDYMNTHEEGDPFAHIEAFDNVGQLVDATLFTQAATCREVANVSTIHASQGLPSEAWMSSSEWGHSVQALSVT
ncbi:hypothetical protein GOP47_0017045 [Adiantum capillus-veneris]|uniref:J domain-containing protein n=1 Tax=Adiantum capillus-veneris TaxID=13818 RepID=A0A9D4ZCX8_ADICA|nr:hypothetical protein GOP47_0016396 [Adiantum capillus-veneris]KAI5068700.1 hypothetical protein GOP47_0017045 [Adiantum capillus-veneris]